MKVELPETVELASGKKIDLKKAGHIVTPDKFNGGQYEKYFVAKEKDDKNPFGAYEKLWDWAKELIVEWAIEGLPTNPNQIKQDDITWALQAFLTHSVVNAMNEYMLGYEDVMEKLVYPEPGDLLPSEFFAWSKAFKKADEEKEKGDVSPLRLAWLTGSTLVREWPNGGKPESYEDADLRILKAIDELLPGTIVPALDLGNWRVPLGEV